MVKQMVRMSYRSLLVLLHMRTILFDVVQVKGRPGKRRRAQREKKRRRPSPSRPRSITGDRMDFNATRGMSAQELRIVRTLEREGAKTLAQLLTALPAADTRTPRTQAASLSRSLLRLAVRGVVERDGLRYVMRTNG